MKTAAALMLAAAAVFSYSCQKETPPDLPSLKAAFGSDEFNVEPGGTISLPFVVNGHENVDVSVSAKVSNPRAEVSVKNPLMYQGDVVFTAPAVSSGENITVTLSVLDEKYNRSVETSTTVVVGSSEPLQLSLYSELNSVVCKSGSSFKIPFILSGLGSAKMSSASLELSPSDWKGSYSFAQDMLSGEIAITAPSSLSDKLSVKFSVVDDFDRKAELNLSIDIVMASEAAGAANCYIVKPGSSLTIKAVEGNSNDKLDFDNAKLVWQDAVGMVKSVSASQTEGVLVVNLNSGISGNAVVAATKQGEIVWSWHLWVSDYDPDENPFVWTSKAGNTFTYMDRNLGAMGCEKYSAAALGLMYQWGRKDPFEGSDGVHSSVKVKQYDFEGNRITQTVEQRPGYSELKSTTLALSIKNPMTFYVAPGSDYPVVDWFTDKAEHQNNDLWGGVSGLKTKYDPCPEGWMVPASGEGWGFRSEYSKGGKLTDSTPYDPSYPWYIEYDDEYCIGFRYKQSDGKEYWFPFTGKLDPNKGDLSGVDGGALYLTRNTSNTLMEVESFAWGNPASEFQLNRSYGATVRCVKVK